MEQKLSHIEKEIYKAHRDQSKLIKQWRNNETKLVDSNPEFMIQSDSLGSQTLIAGLGSMRFKGQLDDPESRVVKRVRQ